MDHGSDFLKTRQYADGKNLRARIELHRQFSTSPLNWFHWVFDHVPLNKPIRTLELGCGPGVLWIENKDRIQPDWQIYLSDFSSGMIGEARQGLAPYRGQFEFCQINAQEIPFPQHFFDVVIANHMLYHVPNIDKAVGDIRRVLKSDGVFLAATNGNDHMQELFEIGKRLIPGLDVNHRAKFSIESFTLDNGSLKIGKHFSQVEKDIFDDSLEVTNATLFTNYILSIVDQSTNSISDAQIVQFEDDLNQMIDQNKFIKINKSQGLFIARG